MKRFFPGPALASALWAILAMAAAALLVALIPQWGSAGSTGESTSGPAGAAAMASHHHTLTLPTNVDSIELHVSLEAPGDAAARSWPFDLTGSDGSTLGTVHAHLSGDAPLSIIPIDVPADVAAIGLRPTGDVDATCAGAALFRMTSVLSADGAHAVASFDIQPCPIR